MNRLRGWLSPPGTPPASNEELGAPTSSTHGSNSSLSLHVPSLSMTSLTSETNALGLTVDNPTGTTTNVTNNNSSSDGISNGSSSSLGRSASKLKSKLATSSTSRQSKSPKTKPTLRQRITSLTRRDPNRRAFSVSESATGRTKPNEPTNNSGRPAHLQIQSDPVIETARASPEDIEGPSTARGGLNSSPAPLSEPELAGGLGGQQYRGRLGRGEDRNHLLSSSAKSSPRPEHPDLPKIRRARSVRSSTSPIPAYVKLDHIHLPKRLIVCCDG